MRQHEDTRVLSSLPLHQTVMIHHAKLYNALESTRNAPDHVHILLHPDQLDEPVLVLAGLLLHTTHPIPILQRADAHNPYAHTPMPEFISPLHVFVMKGRAESLERGKHVSRRREG